MAKFLVFALFLGMFLSINDFGQCAKGLGQWFTDALDAVVGGANKPPSTGGGASTSSAPPPPPKPKPLKAPSKPKPPPRLIGPRPPPAPSSSSGAI